MDILRVVKTSALNVTLYVKPASILHLIANLVIHKFSGQMLILVAFVSTVTLKPNNLPVKCVSLLVLHVLHIPVYARLVFL